MENLKSIKIIKNDKGEILSYSLVLGEGQSENYMMVPVDTFNMDYQKVLEVLASPPEGLTVTEEVETLPEIDLEPEVPAT